MIISHGRSYIFVHIPKTGGTALAMALEGRAKADDLLVGDTPKALKRKAKLKNLRPKGRLWKHSTLADVEGVITREEMDSLFTFTLVRNPWDRMVSYYHWLQDQSFNHPAVKLAQRSNFSVFMNDPLTIASFQHSPYSSYMKDGAGVEHADLYIRLEHLEEDMEPLVKHLGFVPEMPVANKSERPRDWRGFYTAYDAEKLGEYCAQDIAAYGYTFDPHWCAASD